eukprot:1157963-Pelagomonas_calceolata.AAC.5
MSDGESTLTRFLDSKIRKVLILIRTRGPCAPGRRCDAPSLAEQFRAWALWHQFHLHRKCAHTKRSIEDTIRMSYVGKGQGDIRTSRTCIMVCFSATMGAVFLATQWTHD